MKLNLGCGLDIKEGFVNLDVRDIKGVDCIHDLDIFPYPFKDDTFDYVYSRNCLEQVNEAYRVFRELHRICKDNAMLDITVYHFSSVNSFSFHHKVHYNWGSINYLRDKFDILEYNIILSDNKTLIINMLEKFINKHRDFYEKSFMKNLIPAYQINFTLKAIK